ncbi:hypothetical protein GWI33_007497 [Rhynchophorus ferrugineus]|uniref:Uncharacterized protein n=1 Tax=Rhynchophorus ferrugineus TaxID=354439 RepID=A0A834IEB4_RHYFE|nr:hypothetical protein GWI33_007497 [Rhynchophorus ferrugineus]
MKSSVTHSIGRKLNIYSFSSRKNNLQIRFHHRSRAPLTCTLLLQRRQRLGKRLPRIPPDAISTPPPPSPPRFAFGIRRLHQTPPACHFYSALYRLQYASRASSIRVRTDCTAQAPSIPNPIYTVEKCSAAILDPNTDKGDLEAYLIDGRERETTMGANERTEPD